MTTALHIPDRAEFKSRRLAGSFNCEEPDEDNEIEFWYCCPCGCSAIGPLTVGTNFKPELGPSWTFNGDFEKPTLQPSVNHVDHWHGFLTDGEWISC